MIKIKIARRKLTINNATGIFNLLRNLGGSLGISAVTTLFARRAQWHQTTLVARLTPYDRLFRQQLQQSQRRLGGQQAYAVIYERLLKQAGLLAFLDNFRLLTLLCLVCVPLALLLKKTERRGDGPMGH